MATSPDDTILLDRLATLLGPKGFTRAPADMAPWLTDWRGNYSGNAAALLSPASTEEVSAVVTAAAAAGMPIVPQGGNTSMVAGAIPPGEGRALLLSLRRMRAIRAISPLDNAVTCEAGVVLSDLHAAAIAAGRRFPLSLGAKGSATIGGLISTNAGGTQVLRFGPMRSLLLGIEAVLPDGGIYDGLSTLRKDNRGYDLRQLLAGAEGTLGIVTAASLRLVPLAAQRAVAWAAVGDPHAALRLLRRLEELGGDAVETFELVPDTALTLVLQHIPGTRAPLAGDHPWHVLIEAAAPAGAPDPADLLTRTLGEEIEAGRVRDATIAASEAQAEALWTLREVISEAERIDGGSAKHDVSVPVSSMPGFIEAARTEVESSFAGTRVIAFGHLGDGNVHFNVRPPLGAAPGWLRDSGPAVTRFVHDLTVAAGGSISAEHGIGQTKLAEFARLGDPVRLGALRAIKAALDPKGIMNPGKLVPLACPDAAP